MKYSASQAAKATGKSVPTITRAIKSGKISADKDENGNFQIDPAELHRVFKAVTPPQEGGGDVMGVMPNVKPNMSRDVTGETPNNSVVLQRENEMLREMLVQERDTVRDLRGRLDKESDERMRLTLMLTDQRKPETAVQLAPEPKKLPFWKRPLW